MRETGYAGHHAPVDVAMIGFGCLGLVPWVATSPVEPETSDARIRIARHMFLAGVLSIWLGVAISVIF